MADERRKLTKAQLEFLRGRLEEERSRILAVLRTPTAASYDERSEPEEVAQRTAEQNDRVEIADREHALLAEVERALEKIRTGTYGVDERTRQPIPYERLAAIPWARGDADEEGASLASVFHVGPPLRMKALGRPSVDRDSSSGAVTLGGARDRRAV